MRRQGANLGMARRVWSCRPASRLSHGAAWNALINAYIQAMPSTRQASPPHSIRMAGSPCRPARPSPRRPAPRRHRLSARRFMAGIRRGGAATCRLVAPFRRAVQPGVHAPDRVRAARVRGIAVVDHAVLQHEGAHALAFAQVGGRVGAGRRRPGHEFRRRRRSGRQLHGGIVAPEVVFRPFALLGLGERGIEVVVEIAAGRRGPRKVQPMRRL